MVIGKIIKSIWDENFVKSDGQKWSKNLTYKCQKWVGYKLTKKRSKMTPKKLLINWSKNG
jgi:hypothetical protein